MKTPACDPGDFCTALRAESALFIPEIAKSAGTPKRFQHVSLFMFFEVGFIGWIVRSALTEHTQRGMEMDHRPRRR
jgi:hypothetical protein